MLDDLEDLVDDIPQMNKSKASSNNTAGTKLVSQIGLGLAGKRP